jgi:hypothetical protein
MFCDSANRDFFISQIISHRSNLEKKKTLSEAERIGQNVGATGGMGIIYIYM